MPDPFEPIREIRRRSDMLTEVTNKQAGYEYRFERITGASGNSHVTRARAVGFEIVKGDDPENAETRDANGYCVIGDVVLLRIKKDRMNEIEDEMRSEVSMKRGSDQREDTLAKQLSEELSRKLGKQTNVVFSYQDPKDLANRRTS